MAPPPIIAQKYVPTQWAPLTSTVFLQLLHLYEQLNQQE